MMSEVEAAREGLEGAIFNFRELKSYQRKEIREVPSYN